MRPILKSLARFGVPRAQLAAAFGLGYFSAELPATRSGRKI